MNEEHDQDHLPWCILVAGEHHSILNTLGAHASINSIGKAYTLLRKYLPRKRIIVIAQLQECLAWHNQDNEAKVKGIDDPKRAENQRIMWQEKKDIFLQAVDTLLAEGGADYDGTDCNPDCILRVLSGQKSLKYPRVVEYLPTDQNNNTSKKTKVFLSMFGHGNWSAEHENHYFFMPYPIESVLQGLMLTERPTPPPPPPPEVPPGAVLRTEVLIPPEQEQENADQSQHIAPTSTAVTPISTMNDTTTTTPAETVAVAPSQPEQIPSTTTTEASPSSAMYCSGMDLVNMGEPDSWPLYRCINDYQPLSSLPVVIGTNTSVQDGSSTVVQDNEPLSSVQSTAIEGPDDSNSIAPSVSHLPHCITIPPRRPFRVHLNHNTQKTNSSSSNSNSKPPRTVEELNRHDASLLHWQYVFEVCQRLFQPSKTDENQGLGPNQERDQKPGGKEEKVEGDYRCSNTDRCNNIELFIFQQSCGSGGMWLWLQDNPVYEKLYGVSNWPIFVAYTAEPETSAVGASWDVFYSFLDRVLGTKNSNGNGSDKSGDEMHNKNKKENNNDHGNNDHGNKKMTDLQPPIDPKSSTCVDTISVSLLSDTVPLLEKSKSTTLASFYSLVTHAYYRIEPFVHRVNFEFTEQQRKDLFMAKFGVLGTVWGVNSGMEKVDIRHFFGMD